MCSDGIDPDTFRRLSPSRFLSFSFPNPLPSSGNPYADTLRVAVADSPSFKPKLSPSAIAAILVPQHRADDWIFSTPAGHFQLLLLLSNTNLPISRLVLIGDLPASSSLPRPYYHPRLENNQSSLGCFQESLFPLLLALCPKSTLSNGLPSIPFISYEDDVIRCTPIEKLVGPAAGEMLVEDVEIDRSPALPELRRRLRFKTMPNLIQTQVRLFPDCVDTGIIRPEMGSLVQPYLGPMVSALCLNAPAIDEAFLSGTLPRVLCVGVGGGPLLMSLRSHFGFRVLGVEADAAVLSAARRHFGLVEDQQLKVVVSDGIKLIEKYALDQSKKNPFYAIMVDLDEADPMNGISAPPVEFLKKSVLQGARMALHPKGLLIVNVIPAFKDSITRIIDIFQEFFCELYQLEVENGENYVIVAAASPIESFARTSSIFDKLKQLGCERFVDGIKKI